MVFGRGAKIGALIVLLLVGWAFVLQSNKFHVTAATVIACLSFLAVVMTVWNLWRTGAAAAGPTSEDAGWGKPMGARGELEKEKKTLLKGIKEAEFDAAMGKLSKADSDSLIREYRARAIEVIKQIEGLGGANLTTREKIEHEVKARIALDLSDKPSARAKKVVNARAAKADAAKAKTNGAVKPVITANDDDVEVAAVEPVLAIVEPSAEAKAKASAEADVIAAKAQAAAAAEKVAVAEAKAAAARAAAEAAEAKAEAARAMAEAAEAKAEAASVETKTGERA